MGRCFVVIQPISDGVNASLAVAGFPPKEPSRYDIPRAYYDARCDAPTLSAPGGQFYPLLMCVFPGLDDEIEAAATVRPNLFLLCPYALGGLLRDAQHCVCVVHESLGACRSATSEILNLKP